MPQVVTAIAASLLGARIARRFSAKRVYLAGLAAGLVSMSLLIVSRFFESDTSRAERGIPMRFWLIAGFAVLYGVCETVNGNWSQLDMTHELGASTTVAALALTAFWAMVTVGRIGVVAVRRWVPVDVTYRVLPFLLAATFVLIALLSEGDATLGVLAFALAGLGCSALLPLTISFGQEQVAQISAAMAGGVIAFYQLGYGIAAFGVGPLLDGGVTLSSIYAVSAGAAAALGLLSFVVARAARRPHPNGVMTAGTRLPHDRTITAPRQKAST